MTICSAARMIEVIHQMCVRLTLGEASDLDDSRLAVSVDGTLITVVPRERLPFAHVRNAFGSYREAPRVDPLSPRRFAFSLRGDTPFRVHITAYVTVATDTAIDQAPVEQLLITLVKAQPIWQRLLDRPARFTIRTRRDETLDLVRTELESRLGVQFDDDGERCVCSTPACEMELTSAPSPHSDMRIFTLAGTSSEAEDVSEQLFAHLRTTDTDWYVPTTAELEDVGDRPLDRDAILAILSPRWVSCVTGDEREGAASVLNTIVETWIYAAQRVPDALAEMKRCTAELERVTPYAPASRRAIFLTSYALRQQLTLLMGMLAQFEVQSAGPEKRSQLADVRAALVAMEGEVVELGVASLLAHYEEVLTSVDKLISEM
jgi:hypothetical protein